MQASIAIALLAVTSAVSAAELGTLFHTAKERDQLERLRKGETPEAEAIVRPDPVITGYVKRSDGKSTVFIDKQPVTVRNPRLESRLQPKAVERYEPLPMPINPVMEEIRPEDKTATAPPKAPETNSTPSPSAPVKAPTQRKRAEKDD